MATQVFRESKLLIDVEHRRIMDKVPQRGVVETLYECVVGVDSRHHRPSWRTSFSTPSARGLGHLVDRSGRTCASRATCVRNPSLSAILCGGGIPLGGRGGVSHPAWLFCSRTKVRARQGSHAVGAPSSFSSDRNCFLDRLRDRLLPGVDSARQARRLGGRRSVRYELGATWPGPVWPEPRGAHSRPSHVGTVVASLTSHSAEAYHGCIPGEIPGERSLYGSHLSDNETEQRRLPDLSLAEPSGMGRGRRCEPAAFLLVRKRLQGRGLAP
jgi:hypothetical protein